MEIIKTVRNVISAFGRSLDKPEDVSSFDNEKLISTISKETHSFYYPVKGRVRTTDFLEELINEAEKRHIVNSRVIEGAKDFLNSKITEQNGEFIKQLYPDSNLTGFLSIAQKRQSIRKFKENKLDDALLNSILSCAIEAPSSCNRQSWRFRIFKGQEDIDYISSIRRIPFIKKSPGIIAVFIDKSLYLNKKEHEYTVFLDAAAAVMNILYAAEDMGLSACWVNFGKLEITKKNMRQFKAKYNIKDKYLPVSLVVLGYSDQTVKKPLRENLEYYILK